MNPSPLSPYAAEHPRRSRPVLLVLLVITIAVGLASRSFPETLSRFFTQNAGDALWTLAVYLSLAFVFPPARWYRIALGALAISFLVEFSQLLDWNWLVSIRGHQIGRLVFGQGFLAIDLVRYAVGTAAGVGLDFILHRKTRLSRTPDQDDQDDPCDGPTDL